MSREVGPRPSPDRRPGPVPGLAGLLLSLALGGLALPSGAGAQLPSASARALGMAENYTALARGYASVAWNPAGLGVPDGPGFSVVFPAVQGLVGLDPVTVGDLADHDEGEVPGSVRSEWLERIREEGAQEGTFGGTVTWTAFSIENFAVQLSTSATGEASITPDGAEVLLFGNAGRTGEPRDFELGESRFRGVAVSSAALSWGFPVPLRLGGFEDQHFALGVTVTYTVGHLLFDGRDAGSTLESDPVNIRVEFPVMQTDTAVDELQNGTGVGLDVGALWEGGPWRAGVAVHNVVNSFSWDEEKLFFRPGHALFDADSSSSDFDAVPLSEAPFQFRRSLEELENPRVVRAGVALEATRALTLAADFRRRLDEGLGLAPETHAGIGAELRLPALLSVQGGVAAITDGFEFGGGVGLHLGPLHLSAAAAQRETDRGADGVGMFALSFKAR